jgi:hypothetical protein
MDYVFLIEVTVTAPQGWKPRNKTIKCLGVSDQPNAKRNLEEKAINTVKEAYGINYKGVDLKYSVKSTRYNSEFIVVDETVPEISISEEDEPFTKG